MSSKSKTILTAALLAAVPIVLLVAGILSEQSKKRAAEEASTKEFKAMLKQFDRDTKEARRKIIWDSDTESLKSGVNPTCDHCGGKVNHFKQVCPHCGRERW